MTNPESEGSFQWVSHQAANGKVVRYLRWEYALPKVARDLLSTIVYILPAREGSEGKSVPVEQDGGTGFIVQVPFRDSTVGTCAYVVTNSHCVAREGPTFVRFNTAAGRDEISIDAASWVHHSQGDDVAVAEFMLDETYEARIFGLSTDWFLTETAKDTFGPGDGSFFLGRHLSLEGRSVNTPTVRFGNVSMMDVEPVWQGKHRPRFQESVVVEARAYGGYSGSLVWVYGEATVGPPTWRDFLPSPRPGERISRAEEPKFKDWALVVNAALESPMAILGICWGHMGPHGALLPGLHGVTRSEREMVINSGMMLVVPAWKIQELLMSEKVVKRRDELEQQIAAENEDDGAVMDSAQSEPKRDGDRISLAGVDPEGALRALLRTRPHGQTEGPA